MKTPRTSSASSPPPPSPPSSPSPPPPRSTSPASSGSATPSGAGFSAGCLTKRVQVDSPGAIIARANDVADFQQPIINDPGLGGCWSSRRSRPRSAHEPSTGTPANLALPRPYNNLAIPGCAIHDMLNATTGADKGKCSALIDLVLRNSALHLGSQVDQAIALNPTYVILANFGNDYLGAVTSGTVIDGVTVTPLASFTTDTNAAVAKLKARQPRRPRDRGRGHHEHPVHDDAAAVLTSGGKPVFNPARRGPIPLLGPKGCATGVPACPIPADHACHAERGGLPPVRLRNPVRGRAALPNCNNPSPPPAIDASHPGALIYRGRGHAPQAARRRLQRGPQGGRRGERLLVLGPEHPPQPAARTARRLCNFVRFGVTISAAYLTGGAFSYDGVHPTPIGYALMADDIIKSSTRPARPASRSRT